MLARLAICTLCLHLGRLLPACCVLRLHIGTVVSSIPSPSARCVWLLLAHLPPSSTLPPSARCHALHGTIVISFALSPPPRACRLGLAPAVTRASPSPRPMCAPIAPIRASFYQLEPCARLWLHPLRVHDVPCLRRAPPSRECRPQLASEFARFRHSIVSLPFVAARSLIIWRV